MSSSVREEYLEALYKLSESGPVRQTNLATSLGVTSTSTAEMVKKMIKLNLVKKEDEHTLLLTKKGNKAALELIRKHRLSERFLTDILGLPWEKVHDEACKLEHVISPEVEESLNRLLNNPKNCPHGHPIPNKSGTITKQPSFPLTQLAIHKKVEISHVSEEDPEILKYLSTLGLLPDIEVEIEEIGPFKGPLLIKIGSARYALGREVASKVMVKETA